MMVMGDRIKPQKVLRESSVAADTDTDHMLVNDGDSDHPAARFRVGDEKAQHIGALD